MFSVNRFVNWVYLQIVKDVISDVITEGRFEDVIRGGLVQEE
jgi:hypothetical protein